MKGVLDVQRQENSCAVSQSSGRVITYTLTEDAITVAYKEESTTVVKHPSICSCKLKL